MRRTKTGAVVLVVCISAGAALAADPDPRALAEKGAPGRGVPACLSCHGAAGEGNGAAGFPRLAGLNARYLARQLRDLRGPQRESPVMKPIATALTDPEIDLLSRYYEALAPPPPAASTEAAKLALGERLASRGDWSRDLPACFSCHAAGATGVGEFPALAGQGAPYLRAQLAAWKAGARRNDSLQLMKGIAERLTDEESEAVALYLSTLPATSGKGTR